MHAIDLYSGVGGWALGLRMAGMKVITSYDVWGAANETNIKNNRHQAQTLDLRRVRLSDLPSDIDVIVGSPPCTQFSYSNRGGSGNIEDGLQDLKAFLRIVDYVKPRFWAIENVPRVANILEEGLKPRGALSRFSKLGMNIQIVNMEDFGIPQRRRRCIAGNLDFQLLNTYTRETPRRTLGDVLRALSADPVIDPLYGISIPKCFLSDHIQEEFLNEEEERINRASKFSHPVYNRMLFPDSIGRSVRTITATCTRVSRESVVIEDLVKPGRFRRLTLRERASVQGFPISYEFYGSSFGQKLRMIGNAMPPPFAYYVALAFQNYKASKLKPLKAGIRNFRSPDLKPPVTPPEKAGAKYPTDRKFRFAIPSLRLKSGVRFELANSFMNGRPEWSVAFYFGNSKSIQQIALTRMLNTELVRLIPKRLMKTVAKELLVLAEHFEAADIAHMQDVWSHRGPGGTRPFMLLDQLDMAGHRIGKLLSKDQMGVAQTVVSRAIAYQHGGKSRDALPGTEKLLGNAPLICAGLLIGSLANMKLQQFAIEQKFRGARGFRSGARTGRV